MELERRQLDFDHRQAQARFKLPFSGQLITSLQLADGVTEYPVSAGQELAEKTGLDPALMERLKSLGYAGFSGGGSPTITDRALPDPKDRIQVYELISDAIAQSQHGNYPDSTEKLHLALKTEPDSIPVHYLLGLNYYRMHEFPSAVEQLEQRGARSSAIQVDAGLWKTLVPAAPHAQAALDAADGVLTDHLTGAARRHPAEAIDFTPHAFLASKTVGANKAVTVAGLTLGGADAGDYTLTHPTTTASITAKSLTVTGVTANDKIYDAGTSASLNVGSASLSGVLGDVPVHLSEQPVLVAGGTVVKGLDIAIARHGIPLCQPAPRGGDDIEGPGTHHEQACG